MVRLALRVDRIADLGVECVCVCVCVCGGGTHADRAVNQIGLDAGAKVAEVGDGDGLPDNARHVHCNITTVCKATLTDGAGGSVSGA